VGQARRAKVRPARVIIPLVVAAALVAGGLFAAVKFWPTATTADPQPEASVAVDSQSPSTAESSPSPSASTSPSTSAASAAAAEALQGCQQKVEAADEVLKVGKTGVLHWIDHVDTQTDAFNGKLTEAERTERFGKTRVKGPGDVKRYDDAVDEYKSVKASCPKVVKGADSAVAATLKKCNERNKAQQPMLKATDAAMKDWKAHVKFMLYNREHPDPDAASTRQASWMDQYRTAPKNIKAFKKATRNFEDAPSC
jgi:hypothetical protein